MLNSLASLDIKLFFFINHGLKNIVFDVLMPITTTREYWTFPILILFALLVIFGKEKGRETFFLCLIAILISDSVTNQILKPFFHRLRPFETLSDVNQLVKAWGYSMPSSHAVNMFTAAIVISYSWRKTWVTALMFTIAAMVAFSRVYTGVHYPADVFTGALFSVIFSFIAIKLFGITVQIQKRRVK
ncbi:MAG: phosphatase PAP2 family protein [Elusimicrobiota bacterium]